MNARRLRARAVLAEANALAVDLADLVAAAGPVELPTVADWVAEIETTFTPATARTYRPYWNLAARVLGARRLAELTTIDLAIVVRSAGDRARTSHPDGSGRSAEETCVAALRALCARAVAAGHLTADPASALAKPRRGRSRRRALDDHEIAGLADAVRLTSRDPDLDLLLVRFHLETGARRQGALNLRHRDLDPRRCTVWLREKHGDHREQPASPSLVAALDRLHRQRTAGGGRDDGVFLGSAGSPITARHYDMLFARARSALRWDARTPVSAHVLRHTAISNVARLGGYAVAQAFAGHTSPRSPAATSTPPSPRSPLRLPRSPTNPTRWQHMTLAVFGAVRRRGDADVQSGTVQRIGPARVLARGRQHASARRTPTRYAARRACELSCLQELLRLFRHLGDALACRARRGSGRASSAGDGRPPTRCLDRERLEERILNLLYSQNVAFTRCTAPLVA